MRGFKKFCEKDNYSLSLKSKIFKNERPKPQVPKKNAIIHVSSQ